jgi:hypothetical protein
MNVNEPGAQMDPWSGVDVVGIRMRLNVSARYRAPSTTNLDAQHAVRLSTD